MSRVIPPIALELAEMASPSKLWRAISSRILRHLGQELMIHCNQLARMQERLHSRGGSSMEIKQWWISRGMYHHLGYMETSLRLMDSEIIIKTLNLATLRRLDGESLMIGSRWCRLLIRLLQDQVPTCSMVNLLVVLKLTRNTIASGPRPSKRFQTAPTLKYPDLPLPGQVITDPQVTSATSIWCQSHLLWLVETKIRQLNSMTPWCLKLIEIRRYNTMRLFMSKLYSNPEIKKWIKLV